MRIHFLAGVAIALFTAIACDVQAAASKSLANLQDVFPGCKWENVRGKMFSVWSCNTKDLKLTADDALPGFVLDNGSSELKRPVILLFKKAAPSPLKSVLVDIRKASPGKYTASCAFVPEPQLGGKRFTLSPTGRPGRAWQASQKDATMADEPCGRLGEAYAGDRYFEVAPADPTTVIFVDRGSEIQIFDPDTLAPNAKR